MLTRCKNAPYIQCIDLLGSLKTGRSTKSPLTLSKSALRSTYAAQSGWLIPFSLGEKCREWWCCQLWICLVWNHSAGSSCTEPFGPSLRAVECVQKIFQWTDSRVILATVTFTLLVMYCTVIWPFWRIIASQAAKATTRMIYTVNSCSKKTNLAL